MSSQPTNVQLRRIKMERDEAIKQAESDYNAIRERLKVQPLLICDNSITGLLKNSNLEWSVPV